MHLGWQLGWDCVSGSPALAVERLLCPQCLIPTVCSLTSGWREDPWNLDRTQACEPSESLLCPLNKRSTHPCPACPSRLLTWPFGCLPDSPCAVPCASVVGSLWRSLGLGHCPQTPVSGTVVKDTVLCRRYREAGLGFLTRFLSEALLRDL